MFAIRDSSAHAPLFCLSIGRSGLVVCHRHLDDLPLLSTLPDLRQMNGSGSGSHAVHDADNRHAVFWQNAQAGNDHAGLRWSFSLTIATDSGLLMIQLMTARRSSIEYVLPLCFNLGFTYTGPLCPLH